MTTPKAAPMTTHPTRPQLALWTRPHRRGEWRIVATSADEGELTGMLAKLPSGDYQVLAVGRSPGEPAVLPAPAIGVR